MEHFEELLDAASMLRYCGGTPPPSGQSNQLRHESHRKSGLNTPLTSRSAALGFCIEKKTNGKRIIEQQT